MADWSHGEELRRLDQLAALIFQSSLAAVAGAVGAAAAIHSGHTRWIFAVDAAALTVPAVLAGLALVTAPGRAARSMAAAVARKWRLTTTGAFLLLGIVYLSAVAAVILLGLHRK